jgi:hypothetical protein
MPINWNLAGYVNPDIKITPNEVPLEAMLNVGDKLQKDYEFALENDTKLGIALRSILQNANEADKPAAKEAFDFYTNNLKERAASDKYHRMKYQTVADAGEFAAIYKGLVDRNQELKDYEQKYIRERKDLSDINKENLINMHRSKLKGAKFNSENRFVEGLDFDKKLYAGNIETVELLNTLSSGWKADSGGGRKEDYTLTDGTQSYKGIGVLPKGTLIKKTTDGQWEKVSGEEINLALNSALDNHVGFNQMVDRTLEESLYNLPLQEGETQESRRQAVRQDLSKGALDFAKAKNAYESSISKTTTDISMPKGDNDGSGSGSKDGFVEENAAPNLYSKTPVPKILSDKGVYTDRNGVLKIDENIFTRLKKAGFVKNMAPKGIAPNGIPGFISDILLNIAEIFTPNDEVDVFDSKTLEKNPGLNNKVEKLKKINDQFAVAYRDHDWKTVNKILLDDAQDEMNRVQSVQWHVPNPEDPKANATVDNLTSMYVGKNGLGLAQQLKVYDAEGNASSFNDLAKNKIAGETLADKAKNLTFSGRYDNIDGIYDYGSVKFTYQNKNGDVEEVFVEPLTSVKRQPQYLASKINKTNLTDSPVEFDYEYPAPIADALKRSKDKIKVMADYSKSNYDDNGQFQVHYDLKVYRNGKWVDDENVTKLLDIFMNPPKTTN